MYIVSPSFYPTQFFLLTKDATKAKDLLCTRMQVLHADLHVVGTLCMSIPTCSFVTTFFVMEKEGYMVHYSSVIKLSVEYIIINKHTVS